MMLPDAPLCIGGVHGFAPRLLRNADKIVALKHGEVEEVGSHEKLMANRGYYYSLVTKQLSGGGGTDSDASSNSSNEDIVEMNGGAEEEVPDKVPNGASKLFDKRHHSLAKEMKKKGEEGDDDEENLPPPVSHLTIWKKNAPEWPYVLIGALASIGLGAVMPVFGILFGEVLGILGYSDTQAARDDSVTYAIYFVFTGIGSGLAMFLQASSISPMPSCCPSRQVSDPRDY